MAIPKKNTRGNKNTASIEKEDPSIQEAREISKERYELTQETLGIKEFYNKSLIKLKGHSETINTFIKTFGESINLKTLSNMLPRSGYKASKAEELSLDGLKKLLPIGHAVKLVSEIQSGIVFSSVGTKHVLMTEDDLKQIKQDIDNGDLKSFKNALSLVSKETYKYNPSGLYDNQIKEEDRKQEEKTNYAKNLSDMNFADFEANYFEADLLDLKAKTKLDIPAILNTIKAVNQEFETREKLANEIYKASSAEVIEAIKSGEYKCQNPGNRPEIVKENNEVIKKISGEETNLELPSETVIYSDFLFHDEHAKRQCELQEFLRHQKSIQDGKVTVLYERIMTDCTEATVKEQNQKYDSEISNSVVVFNGKQSNQETCAQLTKDYFTLNDNVVFLFPYKTSDDEKTKNTRNKIKPVVSIDGDGRTSMGATPTSSERTTESANIKDVDEITAEFRQQNTEIIRNALTTGKKAEFNDDVSLHREIGMGASNDSDVGCTGNCTNPDVTIEA